MNITIDALKRRRDDERAKDTGFVPVSLEEMDGIIAALEGGRELTHYWARRAERLEKALRRLLDADEAWNPDTLADMAIFDGVSGEFDEAVANARAALEGRDEHPS